MMLLWKVSVSDSWFFTDAVLGQVFTGLTVPAGKTVTQEKEIIIDETADYQFTVTGEDASGATVETATDRLSVQALDPAQKITLTVEASADRTTVYTLPGTVKFVVKVTNNSTVEVKDVTVSASGVQLYSFPSILAGETRDFTRDVSVSMGGQYRFDASVKNQLSETETFQSNIIQIAYAQPTAAPTEAPIVTPPMPVYEDMPTSDGLPSYVGSVQRVLVDGAGNGGAYNLTSRTNGGRLVHLAGPAELVGQFVQAKITGSSKWALFGEAL